MKKVIICTKVQMFETFLQLKKVNLGVKIQIDKVDYFLRQIQIDKVDYFLRQNSN